MKFKKYHRKYPKAKWHYRGISTEIMDNGKPKEIVYYKDVDKGIRRSRVEVYDRSYPGSYVRSYTLTKVPKKYKKIVAELKKEFQKTKWSRAKEVNYN